MSLLRSGYVSNDVIVKATELLSHSTFPIPLCHDFQEIEKAYLTFFQSTSTKAVYLGKVLHLVSFPVTTEEQILNLLLNISISRAIHHDSIISPVGWVRGNNIVSDVKISLFVSKKFFTPITIPRFYLLMILRTQFLGKHFLPTQLYHGVNVRLR